MDVINGKKVCEGLTCGRLFFYRKTDDEINQIYGEDSSAETQRLLEAQQKAIEELEGLYNKTVREINKDSATIFNAHKMMLLDPGYLDTIKKYIEEEKYSAEYAIIKTKEKISAIFMEMEDEYLKERIIDVEDISIRLLNILTSGNHKRIPLKENSIIIAHDLTPGELMQLDLEKISGIVLQNGSINSHTSILLRSRNIPSIIQVNRSGMEELDGMDAILNSREGKLIINPSLELIAKFNRREEAEVLLHRRLKGKESVSIDGKQLDIYANVTGLSEIPYALEQEVKGIGLFRSEFLYMNRDDFPSEEEQFEIYKNAAILLNGKKLIIRTADIGGDKQLNYFHMEKEENPALGMRGVRLYIDYPDMIRTQLRAILRASVFGNIAVMLPMIISIDEVRKVKVLFEEIKAELSKQSIEFQDIEFGAMIETPAAVMISDSLAKEVDFFSIGTNDLTQYTLAIDRENPNLEGKYDIHHPAILQLIEMVVKNAHRNRIKVAICGELGADLELTETFLRMGIDELSVAPSMVLSLKKKIRETAVFK